MAQNAQPWWRGFFKTGKFGLTRLRFLSDASTTLSLSLSLSSVMIIRYLTLAWRVHQILYLGTYFTLSLFPQS